MCVVFVSYPGHGKVIRGECVIAVDRTLSTIRARIIEYGERVNSTSGDEDYDGRHVWDTKRFCL